LAWPKVYSFNFGIQQKTHLQEYSSKHQESPQQNQEGPVRSLHIKTDSHSVSGGVIWSLTAEGVGLSLTVQKGVITSSDSIIMTPSAGPWFAVPIAKV